MPAVKGGGKSRALNENGCQNRLGGGEELLCQGREGGGGQKSEEISKGSLVSGGGSVLHCIDRLIKEIAGGDLGKRTGGPDKKGVYSFTKGRAEQRPDYRRLKMGGKKKSTSPTVAAGGHMTNREFWKKALIKCLIPNFK